MLLLETAFVKRRLSEQISHKKIMIQNITVVGEVRLCVWFILVTVVGDVRLCVRFILVIVAGEVKLYLFYIGYCCRRREAVCQF
jgi:hypothetical protein